MNIGTGPDSIVVNISEDAYLGDAEFTISIDGEQIGGTLTATALEDAGQTEAFTLLGAFAPGEHDVSIDFLNDSYGGAPTMDRNLYVDSITTAAGTITPNAALMSSGAQSFEVAVPSVSAAPGSAATPSPMTIGTGPDSIILNMSEDFYLGDAEFTVSVDGQQISGTLTATALHDAGQTQAFTLLGNFGSGVHTVTIDFLNDAYGGSASTDRNLYVDSITTPAGSVVTSAELASSGSQSFMITTASSSSSSGDPTKPVTVGAGSDSIVLDISEDAYLGDAQFTISVNGQQIGGTLTATALHGDGQTEAFTVLGNFGTGALDISVDFLNDAYGGTASTDRNLYVDSITTAGGTLSTDAALKSAGTQEFTSMATSAPITVGSGSDSIVVDVSEDAYLGDAEFTISVDGQQIGGVLTATALHGNGETEAFTVQGSFAPGTHTVSVNFLNDAFGGTAATDRNLYVDSITTAAGTTALDTALDSSGSTGFSVIEPPASLTVGSGPDSLVVNVSEDFYLLNAQFTISIDGQQVGGVLTATALHDAGQTQTVTVLGTFAAGAHTVSIDFLNDAYGGTATTDRNLYVDSVQYGGTTTNTDTALLSSGSVNLGFTVPGTPPPTGPSSGNSGSGSTGSTGSTGSSSSSGSGSGSSDPSGTTGASPTIPQPTAAGDIVGLVLQNPLGTALGAQEITFAQTFAEGQVAAGGQIMALINGVQVAVQMDVKTTYADGSAETTVLTLLQPALAADSSTGVMLVHSNAAAGAAINLASALNNYSLSVDLSMTNADGSVTPVHIDAIAAMRAALSAGTATYWLQGPNATQAEVDVPVSGSLHLVFDITAYANGTFSADVQFDNDLAMGAVGGAVQYNATITQNGSVAYQQSNIQQLQYENWHQEVWSAGAPGVNVQHDIAALEATGAVPNYDLTTGVSTALLASDASAMAAAGWGTPLAANGVTQGMPTTGGRGDIGPTTQSNAAWLMSQSATAANYALGQADAAGAVPWNFYNAAAGTWLDTAQYPDIWTDGRGGAGSYTTGLTQQVSTDTAWVTDQAHQPDLSYVAYLMTGSQYYLNELNAQASFSIVNQWPSATAGRNGAADNLIQGEQVRGAAWSLRQIDEAAYANPTGSAEKAYFTGVENANWQWLVAQLPAWTAQEGQTSGYIPGGYSGGTLPPWQQDYFISTAVQAAEQGNADALTYLKWSTNFIAGRFLNADAGFNPHNGAAYNLGVATPTGATVTTWAELQAATVVIGQDNGAGWANSEGDYAELALQSLAGIITTTGSTQAIEAYGYLVASGAPFIDAATHQSDTQFDIVPRLTDGALLTGDHIYISSDTINGTTVSESATADQLITETGTANVTITGGSGINLLFAGSGTTSLVGGANADYLFGSTGQDTFSGGAGNNYMMAGTGAATFNLNGADVAKDIIAGFKIGTDLLKITQGTGAAFDASQDMSLIRAATSDSSGSAVLHLSATHTVTLSGIATSQLTQPMFG